MQAGHAQHLLAEVYAVAVPIGHWMKDDGGKLVAPHDLSCQVGLARHEGVAKLGGALPNKSGSISAGVDTVWMHLSEKGVVGLAEGQSRRLSAVSSGLVSSQGNGDDTGGAGGQHGA